VGAAVLLDIADREQSGPGHSWGQRRIHAARNARAPKGRNMTMTLVCPPISPWSSLAEIDAWIAFIEPKVQAAPDDEGLRDALDSARRMRAFVAASPRPE
jgi:hypothetical protein